MQPPPPAPAPRCRRLGEAVAHVCPQAAGSVFSGEKKLMAHLLLPSQAAATKGGEHLRTWVQEHLHPTPTCRVSPVAAAAGPTCSHLPVQEVPPLTLLPTR